MAYVSLAQDGGVDSFRVAWERCGVELPGTHNGCEAVAASASFAEAGRLSQSDFAQFLRFYTVKPLYVGAARVLERAFGVSAFRALRTISAGSFLLLGVLLWCWMRRWWSPAKASVLALSLVSSPQVLALGRGLLPDGLLTAMMLTSTFLLLVRRGRRVRWLGAALLLIATLVRPDAALFSGLFAGALLWRETGSRDRRWLRLGGLGIAIAGWMLALGRFTHALPWRVQFVHAFVAWTPPAEYAALHVSLGQYARVMSSNGVRTVLFCLPVALFLAAVALLLPRRALSMRLPLLAALAATALRVGLFPGVEDRYYVGLFLLAALAVVEAASPRAEAHIHSGVAGIPPEHGDQRKEL